MSCCLTSILEDYLDGNYQIQRVLREMPLNRLDLRQNDMHVVSFDPRVLTPNVHHKLVQLLPDITLT